MVVEDPFKRVVDVVKTGKAWGRGLHTRLLFDWTART